MGKAKYCEKKKVLKKTEKRFLEKALKKEQ